MHQFQAYVLILQIQPALAVQSEVCLDNPRYLNRNIKP